MTNDDIACIGKPAMATRSHAEAVIRTMIRARRRRADLQAYRCKRCGHWHVGSTAPRQRKDRAAVRDWQRPLA